MFKLGFSATVRVFGSGDIGGYSGSMILTNVAFLAIREVGINCPFHVKLAGARYCDFSHSLSAS